MAESYKMNQNSITLRIVDNTRLLGNIHEETVIDYFSELFYELNYHFDGRADTKKRNELKPIIHHLHQGTIADATTTVTGNRLCS
jgi:hypothetical protein